MRFSIIAVILQNTIFFGTALAAHQGFHISEENKAFDCDGRIIRHSDYSSQQYSASQSISNNEYIETTSIDFLNKFLMDYQDRRCVLFLDGNSRNFYLTDLDITPSSKTYHSRTHQTSYSLVIDNRYRAVAIIMKLTSMKPDGTGWTTMGTGQKICGIFSNGVM
ncbi:BgTH12-05186 [Blumeria graminis f. sp. triticale]|uniref:BgtE-20017 n=3 Tax=Blumeria graminis TaxID=34373 RepID=A0A381L7R3_BLUGR|nr:BgTH12-05186 [Blumeria graminis f. sp. triticale]VDB88012.1 BgtE-20017 [Blumeria graminis f. sp. tritici]